MAGRTWTQHQWPRNPVPPATPTFTRSSGLQVPYSTNAPAFGSDVVAETLSALDIPYIALNPGASYRGLHDSIVNFLGNEQPQMLLCLHEEAAVAIAHGYAKVTGKAMAAAVHSNVGLFHATMAIFNAWCDRMPILILGATGPVDAMKRRPWIDWIHTAADQGAIIRNFTKWDDQPASAGAARESVLRAYWMSNTAPCGPTYINLDAEVQEGKLPAPLPPIDAKRYMPPVVQGPSADLVKKAADILLDRQEAADPGRPHVAQGRGLEAAHRARRGDRRARGDEPQDRRGVPDRSSAAYRLSGDLRHRRPDQRGEGRRRHPQPRLGRSRRHLQGHRRRAVGDRDPGLARPEPAQRLEHGLRGAAGGGPVHPGRIRRDRRGAARSRRGQGQAEEAASRARASAEAEARAGQRNGRGRHGQRAAPRRRRPHHLSHPRLAVLARRVLAVPPSARLCRLRRRRRRRRRPGHLGRRGAGAQGHAAACRSRSAATATS